MPSSLTQEQCGRTYFGASYVWLVRSFAHVCFTFQGINRTLYNHMVRSQIHAWYVWEKGFSELIGY